jgi:regulator of replication initiation timing
MEWVTIIGFLMAPVTGVVTWIATRAKQKNDFLKDMQASIDMLSSRNKDLLNELISLRGEVAQLKNENVALRIEVEVLNKKLEYVKITNIKK